MWFSTSSQKSANTVRRRRAPVYTLHAKSAARRNENFHKTAAVALLLVALGGVGWLALRSFSNLRDMLFHGNQHFVVRSIETTSSGRLTTEHLKEYGGFAEGANLFDLDIRAIKQRLEDVPMIRDVSVQRRLPSTLVLRVNERVPFARISQGQTGFFLSVDREGMVLGPARSQLRHLPVIKGFSDRGVAPGTSLRDAGAADALHLITMVDSSAARDTVRIVSIDVAHPDYLDLALDNGIKVLLPRNVSRGKLDDLVAILRESSGRFKFFDLTLDRNYPAS